MSIAKNWNKITQELPEDVLLVAVSKYRSEGEFMALYECGQRDFAENRVQELQRKKEELPDDIRWHMIGHLQRNKVKYIAPWVHMIHSVDSPRLAAEINKQALSAGRSIPCLLQVHIASEESKFGFSREELLDFLKSHECRQMQNIEWRGLMGMASNTPDQEQVRREFSGLKDLLQECSALMGNPPAFNELSMGMSNDYLLALECGASILRLGSVLFA
jgi:pyridoxal phosphate enzyme (YggS family)